MEMRSSLLALLYLLVRPSVRMEQLGSNCTDFLELLILGIRTKICRPNSGFVRWHKRNRNWSPT